MGTGWYRVDEVLRHTVATAGACMIHSMEFIKSEWEIYTNEIVRVFKKRWNTCLGELFKFTLDDS